MLFDLLGVLLVELAPLLADLPAWLRLVSLLVAGGGLAKLLSALFGGVTSYLQVDAERDAQEHDQEMSIRQRMDSLELRLDEEIRTRRQAESEVTKLTRKIEEVSLKLDEAMRCIQHLVALLNTERAETGKEPLSNEELEAIMPPYWDEHKPTTTGE